MYEENKKQIVFVNISVDAQYPNILRRIRKYSNHCKLRRRKTFDDFNFFSISKKQASQQEFTFSRSFRFISLSPDNLIKNIPYNDKKIIALAEVKSPDTVVPLRLSHLSDGFEVITVNRQVYFNRIILLHAVSNVRRQLTADALDSDD